MNFLEASASELPLVEREILIQATEKEPVLLKFIGNMYKAQKVCEKTVEAKGWTLHCLSTLKDPRNVPQSYKGRPMVFDVCS